MRNNIPIISRFALVSLIVLLLFSTSCDSEVEPVKPLLSYNAFYMFYPESMVSILPPIVTIEFDAQGKISRRIGGALTTSGYGYSFTTEIYDEIIITEESVSIMQKENIDDFEFTAPYQEQLFFEGNRIDFKVRPQYVSATKTIYDTTFFQYSTTGVLEKTVRRSWSVVDSEVAFNFEEVKSYTFQKQNLTQVDGRYETKSGVITTTIEKFENYDNAVNPTKSFIILDELFYRALSKNNFSQYSYKKMNDEGVVIESRNKTWSLEYERGVPTYR